MEHAAAMSSSLLDFESSIQNELQAELLLGQDINLESARALALQGDQIGAAKEVLKNESILKAFKEGNVIQQEVQCRCHRSISEFLYTYSKGISSACD